MKLRIAGSQGTLGRFEIRDHLRDLRTVTPARPRLDGHDVPSAIGVELEIDPGDAGLPSAVNLAVDEDGELFEPIAKDRLLVRRQVSVHQTRDELLRREHVLCPEQIWIFAFEHLRQLQAVEALYPLLVEDVDVLFDILQDIIDVQLIHRSSPSKVLCGDIAYDETSVPA